MSIDIPVCTALLDVVACADRGGSRLLGPLERQLVMNLLWLESAIPASTMSAWVTSEGKK